jgi:hypothetical protein
MGGSIVDSTKEVAIIEKRYEAFLDHFELLCVVHGKESESSSVWTG